MKPLSDKDVVNRLNEAVKLDPVCVGYVIDWRTNINSQLASHQDAVVHTSYWGVPEMGILELLNFVLGANARQLEVVKDEQGNLVKFKLVRREVVKCQDEDQKDTTRE